MPNMMKASKSNAKRAPPSNDMNEHDQLPSKKTHIASSPDAIPIASPLTSNDDDDDDDGNSNLPTTVDPLLLSTATSSDNTSKDITNYKPQGSTVTAPLISTSNINVVSIGTWDTYCNARWTQKLRAHIPSFLIHADDSMHRYSIAALPSNIRTMWVCQNYSHKNNQMLCVDNDAPLILWITGEVKCALFHYADGGPRMCVSININPIYEGDETKINNYLRNHASINKGDLHDNRGLWASRYQGLKSRSDQKPSPYAITFNNCFDGTTRFGPCAEMERHPAVCIVENDLIIFECTITQFKCNANGDAIYDGDWKLWRTQLKLLTLSKLFDSSEPSMKEDVRIADNVFI